VIAEDAQKFLSMSLGTNFFSVFGALSLYSGVSALGLTPKNYLFRLLGHLKIFSFVRTVGGKFLKIFRFF
jgi:hypothetical protein